MDSTEFEGQAAEESGLFDLDVTIIESGEDSGTLIAVTDDGCGSTCSSPCATNVA